MRAVDDSRSRFINDERMQPWHIFTKESQQLLNSGEVVHLPIEIFATSAIIRKGHRLRISVSASNQAQGVLNNTQKANTSGGVTTIHHSADYPSSILLPTVPTSSLN
jgi:hypothetical protein